MIISRIPCSLRRQSTVLTCPAHTLEATAHANHQYSSMLRQPTEAGNAHAARLQRGVERSAVGSSPGRLEPDPAAQFVWSSGADYGVFEGDDCDAFVKDLPLDRVAADVLIAFEMNGSPLRPENGYPMRLGPISPIASMTARIHAGSGLKDFPRAFNTSGHIPIPPVAASGDPSYSPDCGLPRCLC